MGSAGLLFGTGGAIFDGIAAFSEGGEATETMEMRAQAFNVQALLIGGAGVFIDAYEAFMHSPDPDR